MDTRLDLTVYVVPWTLNFERKRVNSQGALEFFSRVGTVGCRFRCLFGAFGGPRAALGVAWGSFGGPLGAFFGVFGAPLGSPGSPRKPLSVPGGLFGRSWAAVWPSGSLWGRPPGNSGKFWGPFWGHFGVIFHDFSVYFRVLFFHRFLMRFCMVFEPILGAFFEYFFDIFQTPRKMLNPTKV